MAELTIFKSDQFGEIRTVNISGEPWFVGKDVAEVLGYSNPNEAVGDHVDDEDKLNSKTLSSFNLNIGQRGGWIINESGLYSLILSSKLPTAKEFKRWVTSEVLPSIRKHSAYMTPDMIEKVLTDPDMLIGLAQQLKAAKVKVAELVPKAAYYDRVTESAGSSGIRDTAKLFGMKLNEFTDYLIEKGYCYRNGKNVLMPRSDKQWAGMFEVCEYMQKTPSGTKTRIYTVITPKGRAILAKRMEKEREEANARAQITGE